MSPQFHIVVDDDFATVPSLRAGTIPANWHQLVTNSRERSTEGFYDATKTLLDAGIDETATTNNEVEVREEVLPTGTTNLTTQQDEMIDKVGPDIDGTSDIPPEEDMVENSHSTPTIIDTSDQECDESQNEYMRVRFDDSP